MRRLALVAACLALWGAVAGESGVSPLANLRTKSHTLPLRGLVTYSRGFDSYFFMLADDGTGVWRIDRDERPFRIEQGDIVEVTAGKTGTATTPRINHATVRRIGHDESELPTPIVVTVADLYRHPLNDPTAPDLWGRNVVCSGTVRDINRRESFTQIQVSDGERSFQAAAYVNINKPLPEDLKLGARVRVEGIMLYTTTDDRARGVMTGFDNVSVMPASIHQVTVLSRAPFWTPPRVWAVAGAGLALFLAALAWAATLRRAVNRKAAQLEETLREKVRDKVEADAIRRERLRFSYELHDNFQQLLASCRFRLETLDLILPPDAAAERAQLEKAQTALDYTQHGLRTALWGMTEESEGPKSFTGLLRFAMGRMAHWEGVVFLDTEGDEPPGARKFAGLLLMVLQEAVGNAIRHGKATRVDVRVAFRPENLVFAVADNGCGFDATQPFGAGHLGLAGMKMRVASCGGTLTLESSPGSGTTVTATIPLTE